MVIIDMLAVKLCSIYAVFPKQKPWELPILLILGDAQVENSTDYQEKF